MNKIIFWLVILAGAAFLFYQNVWEPQQFEKMLHANEGKAPVMQKSDYTRTVINDDGSMTIKGAYNNDR
jgi:hypothetical protein